MRQLFFALGIAIISGCSPVQKSETIRQDTGSTLIAGVGDVVVKVDRYRNLENVFGKADIFGRRTYEGSTEIRYMGVRGDGIAAFARQDVSVHSNETTMSRSGIYVPNTTNTTTTTTGFVGNVPVSGTSRTTGVSGGTYIPPKKSETVVLPPNTFEILIDLNKERVLIVSGRRVDIISASANQITYRVSSE